MLLFRHEGEIKVFPEEQKLRELTTTRPALQERLKGVFEAKMKTLISDIKTRESTQHCSIGEK